MIKTNTILFLALMGSTCIYAQETPDTLHVEEEVIIESDIEEEIIIEEVEVITINEDNNSASDTTRIKIGSTEIVVIEHGNNTQVTVEEGGDEDYEDYFEEDENYDEYADYEDFDPIIISREAHWAGLELGFTTLMNSQYGNNFQSNPYWDNDEAKSQEWNLNLLEYKFNIGKSGHVGITTGAGFSWNAIAFKDNYVLIETSDSLYAEIDTINTYTKNKLKASYFRIPLLLEFNATPNKHNSFYLSAGVIGAVRMTSKTKRKGSFEGKEFKQKNKGTYALESFKLDATVRLGYGTWGAYASYSLFPLFNTNKTVEVYPLTFGLSLNF